VPALPKTAQTCLHGQKFTRGPALRDVSRHRAYTYRDTYQIRRLHTYTPTHLHVHTYAHTPAHLHVHTCAPTRTHLRTYTYTPAHLHVHTYAHTRTHLHTYTYQRTLKVCVLGQSPRVDPTLRVLYCVFWSHKSNHRHPALPGVCARAGPA